MTVLKIPRLVELRLASLKVPQKARSLLVLDILLIIVSKISIENGEAI